ncbi:Rid family hydrolase [Bacteriovoracaceae bacterium]|nr:Rid family hydrolase [Bacteriovoracaceae bacterium]
MKYIYLLFLSLLWISCSSVKRFPMKSSFPISSGVSIGGNTEILYLSGAIPKVFDESAQKNSSKYWGTFTDQTRSTFEKIKESLEEKGYSLDNIVKMYVYIVPNDQNKIPFKKFMSVYKEYFSEPKFYPARTVVGTPALALDNLLIEIQVIAAK